MMNLTTADNDVAEDDGTYENTTQSEPAEEEPETAVWIAGKLIEEKDEFESLGEGKGEYKYYDGTLILKKVVIEIEPEYGGAAIVVQGTLVIELEGDNYLTTTGGTEVLAAYLYDYEDEDKENTLTITGDGSLTLSNKGDGKIIDNKNYWDGIYVSDGNLVIDGTEVTSDIYTNTPGAAAINVYGGDLDIINGANVTAKTTPIEDIPTPYYGIYVGEGKINISGASNVIASADGDASGLIESIFNPDYDGKLQLGIGMMSKAYSDEESGVAGIIIDDSNVRSIGSLASMMVLGLDGTIKINDSTIVSPDDVNVRELMATISDDPDAALQQIGAILAKGEGEINLDEVAEKIQKYIDENDMEGLEAYLTELFDSIAKDVNIVRDAELQAQKAGLGIGDGVPTTGDNFQAEGLLIAMFAASVAIVYCIRRKVSA